MEANQRALPQGAAWGLSKWEGLATQGVLTPFAARLSPTKLGEPYNFGCAIYLGRSVATFSEAFFQNFPIQIGDSEVVEEA
jgi:hypothetical protein